MPPRLPSLPLGLCICLDPNCKIPYGECHCRCGEKVALAKRSYTRDGIVKGFPLWYIDGHVGFKRPEIIDADPIEINGYRCRLIPLTQGQFAMVSPHRYKDLMRWKWYAWWNPTTRSYYAVRTVQMPDGRRVSIYMCRFILGLEPGNPLTGDHAETGDTLNNTDENIRPATPGDQQHNKRVPRNNTSGFKGVSLYSGNRWLAMICVNRKQIRLGIFDSPEEAYLAYCEAAKKYFGEFARLK